MPDFKAFPDLLTLHQGRVDRKPVNANPELKVNRGNNYSPIKMLSTTFVLCSLRLLMLKTEGQKIYTEHLAEMRQTEIKILANPGLA